MNLNNTRTIKRALLIGFISMAIAFILTSPWITQAVYRSETIIYVPLFVPAKQMEQQGIGFASDKEIDGHIQILKSGMMKDTLNKLFSLSERYGIDLNELGGKANLHRVMSKKIEIQKTRYSSVSITVEDHDPQLAADIANKLVQVGDDIKEDLLAVNRTEAVSYAQRLVENQEERLRFLVGERDSLYGQHLDSTLKETKIRDLNAIIDREYQDLLQKRDNLKHEKENLGSPLPSSYVISAAVPMDRSVWPPGLILEILAFFGGAIGYWLVVFYLQSGNSKE